MPVIRDGKSRDCSVCYFCDFATCQYNGKKRKGKMRVRHCPVYRETVKSKANKSSIRQMLKNKIRKKSTDEIF